MTKIMIIGAGAGGTSLLSILSDYSEIEVTGIIDIDPEAPGMILAKKLGIKTSNSFTELYQKSPCEIVINASGNEEVSTTLRLFRQKHPTEIIEGASARVIFKLVDERRIREQEALLRLNELEALYQIGIMLTSSESESKLLNSILEYSTKLTNTPAGSIALYDEINGQMELVLSVGFKDNLSVNSKWKIRKGGLTEYILNQNGKPLIINNIDSFKKVNQLGIENMGIKSLIAMPLIVERRIIGILYIDDFIPREFSKNEVSVLSLLATQAAIAIEKMQRFERTRVLAITDGLTGLYNHSYYAQSLKREIKRARRDNSTLSVIIMDIDHFKHYNDTNGHLPGNEALKKAALVIKQAVRDIDILARYGGEEFAVILPDTNSKHAHIIANRICTLIRNETFHGAEKQPMKRLTISAGVATFPQDAGQDKVLTDRADKALYIAKEQGRDRVVSYREN